MSFAVTTFRDWCIRYGCSHALYIGSFDFQRHRTVWDQSKLWNEADLNRTFLAEFGFVATGNASALPPGADPILLSKDTAASNHESGQMAQLTLNVVLGPAAFGLPPAYRFTIWDGQAAVTLEDPHQQGACLWDGVIRAMLLAKAPAPPPPPPPQPPPPAPPPAGSALPPLTPAAKRIVEVEARVVSFCMRMVPASFSSLPLGDAAIRATIKSTLFAARPITKLILKTWRRDDPRPLPLEDL